MKIIVCIKQVPDTTEVKLDPVKGTLIREGIPSIMNPDDKAGLEAALRIKDQIGAEVSVISMGPRQAESVLREALAMGADNAYLLTDIAFGGADTLATSITLAAAIKNLDYDLIITGRQAIDGDTAQVGPQIAEHLGIPNVSYAEDLEVKDGYLVIKRQYEDQYHLVKVKTPCLFTALTELNKPRYLMPGKIFEAFCEKEIIIWGQNDIAVNKDEVGLKGSPTKVSKSFPKSLKASGVKIALEKEEAADFIIEKLKEKFII